MEVKMLRLILGLCCICFAVYGSPATSDGKAYAAVKRHYIEHLQERLTGEVNGGAIYTRWGRTVCGRDSTPIYTGYAAGPHANENGGTSTHLCLPDRPTWKGYDNTFSTWSPRLYGVEYEMTHYFGTSVHNHDAPCVVCESDRRSRVLMVPGKVECFPGWHTEYSGYLMGDAVHHRGRSDYICVDDDPEAVPGGAPEHGQAVLYYVETACGSLPCPPYSNGREVSCAVCTK